jgi:YD repeat-containing protein
MAAVWKLGEARVEDVRATQLARSRSGYTTIQTVLNRLVDRGLLTRERDGAAFVYRARYDEADYLARTIGDRLAGATPAARKSALLHLVDELDGADLDEIARYANRIRRRRRDG